MAPSPTDSHEEASIFYGTYAGRQGESGRYPAIYQRPDSSPSNARRSGDRYLVYVESHQLVRDMPNTNSLSLDCSTGQMLFDEYALPSGDRYVPWRRPSIKDLIDAQKNRGRLIAEAHDFANRLKAAAIWIPHILVHPFWLFNNPLLFLLAGLPDNDPNQVRPLFRKGTDFCRPYYWGERCPQLNDALIDTTYPQRSTITQHKKPASSWMADIYSDNGMPAFNQYVRPSLHEYVATCLGNLSFQKLKCNPGDYMRECLLAMYDDPASALNSSGIPIQLKSEAERVISCTAEQLIALEKHSSAEAERMWRQQASVDLRGVGSRVDWIFRERMHLRGHTLAVGAVPSGYGCRAIALGDLAEFIVSPTRRTDVGRQIVYSDRAWRALLGWNNTADYLSKLSFETIVNDIRASDFYRKYASRLRELDTHNFVETYDRLAGALEELMGDVAPILRKKADPEVFCGSKWKVTALSVDKYDRVAMWIDPILKAANVALKAGIGGITIGIGIVVNGIGKALLKSGAEPIIRSRHGRHILTSLARGPAGES